ncbi:hypothetical protein SEA_COLUCCI_52 [Arthrobacter phage Colucci]|uniref:DNA-binding phage zinc finger domain-containing protein n=1 Tax=Arthrobacter phage Colucci TaxID=2015834 RepID=A0A286N2W5_9CAUD|nr:hypothetical protein FDI27_gp052 [Arthrobacter phage Colucci]ASX98722.1 hypothetical protein SEA_COLUCCI_52 [Arthrobacter phage Colucci]
MPDMSNAQLALMAAASYTTPEFDTIDGVTSVADSFLIWLDQKDASYQAASRVKCPTCSAAAGNVCRDRWNGVMGTMHPDRISAAAAAPPRGPLSVACVYCLAGIGEPCKEASGFVFGGFHTSREQEATK